MGMPARWVLVAPRDSARALPAWAFKVWVLLSFTAHGFSLGRGRGAVELLGLAEVVAGILAALGVATGFLLLGDCLVLLLVLDDASFLLLQACE